MAQNPNKPKQSGKVQLPSVDVGMNKTVPKSAGGGKGGDDEVNKLLAKEDETDDAKILGRLHKRMERCINAESENRKAALEDLKFKNGEQWPADVAAQRNFDKRPCLTINKIPTFIHQVTNDIRQNRPSINVNPVGDRGDLEVAKMYRGLIRAIERQSHADVAYDTASDNAVSNGFGYFRLQTEYESPDTFDQVLVVKRIRNPFTVYLDPDHIEPDGSDCRFQIISDMIPRSEFEDKHKGFDPIPYDQAGLGEDMKKMWVTKDAIRVVEYFEIEYKMRKLVALDNGHVGFEDELVQDVKDAIASGKLKVVKDREAELPKVHWYKCTAKQILERTPWVGKWCPIVKVIGEEIDVEGKVTYSGVIRNSKDSQRMYNYWKTAETELIALAPKAPWVMEEGQVEGHEPMWKQANVKSFPYLLYKNVNLNGRPAPAPQRQPFAGVPAGVTNAALGAAQDMMATTGIRFDSTMGERMVDESGKAIRALTQRGELGSFHFVDNLSRSLRHLGDMMIDAIPKVYDTKRMLTILREDDTEEQVQIDPSMAKGTMDGRHPQTQKTLKIFNPKFGKYGCTVTIGPSYATKRIEASESMMAFAKALPNTAQYIADLIAKNQDWPGAQEMATRLAKMLPPNLLTPDQKDMTPQIQALLQSMDAQIKQLMQEHQLMVKELTDKEKDRAQKQDKIDKDFEAKILGIVEKAEANFNTHIGAQIKELGAAVGAIHAEITKPREQANGAAD